MKKDSLKPVSPGGLYGITYGSGGDIIVTLIETGDTMLYLLDNDAAWVRRAVFSRDMRRILCLNNDHSVGVWAMPPRKARQDMGARDIVEYIHYRFFYGDYFTTRRRH